MVFDDEMDFETNENTTSKDTKPQLEKYGVWIKKGPETLESPQEIPEINDIPDITETSDFSDISVMEEDVISSENEQIESINDELSSLIDTTSINEEASSFVDAPIDIPVVENNPTTTEEPQIPVDTGLPEGFDIPGIDLSAFENADIPTPKPAEPEGEVAIDMDDFFSSDSGDGEVDLSSFFGDGESIDFDDFMGGDSGGKKEPEIIDQEPLDIQLEFDDNFVLETKADSLSQVEFIGLDGESGEMSFDDLFDNIQDESGISASDFDTSSIPSFDPSAFETEDLTSAFMDDAPVPQTAPVEQSNDSNAGFDDASEFDDLLSSLDEATPLTDTPEEAKTKKLFQDYDITVTMDEEDLSEDDEEDNNSSDDDWDDISLFQSNEDIENFKQQSKNNGAPVGGMKVLEAQSAMDFDEIDKILDEGGFSFPSDEVKEESVENVSMDDANEISIDDVQLEATEQTIEMDNTTSDSVTEIPTEDEFTANITEENSFISDDLEISPTLEEPVIEDSVSEELETEPTIEFNTEVEEPIIEDSMSEELETEPTIEFNTEVEEPVIEDSMNEELEIEPTIEFESTVEEPIIEDSASEELETEPSIEDTIDESFVEPLMEDSIDDISENEELTMETSLEDDTLDASFNTTEEIEEQETVVEEPIDNIPSSEDNLLDMDFAEDSLEETSEEENNDITKDSIEEQGDTMNEINENSQITAQPDNTANAILEKIATEISNLRSEITTLRSEFNSLKTGSVVENEIEDENLETAEEESSGFFTDDNEDETISLSGDELNNILNNADFTEEQSDDSAEEVDNTETEEDEIIEPEKDSEETVVEETVVEDQNTEEVISNPIGDATELTDSDLDTIDEYEEDNFAEDSDFADEDLKEPELHELQMDNDFEENDEEELEEEIDIPKDEEVIEEPESNDFIDSINEVEPTISETLTEDRLKYLEDLAGEEKEEEPAEEVENEIVEPEVEDTVMEKPATDEENTEDSEFEEPVVEENEEESQFEEPVEETAEIIEEEDEEAEQNEPTEDVFNSPQWDNEVPTVENVIAETEEEIEEVSEPVEEESNEVVETEIEQTIEEEPEVENVTEEDVTEQQISQPEVSEAKTEVVSPTPSAQGATAKIQDDIKSVLVYMDQLLENLPEDKIEEFAKSEHFDTYKKLFNELGISN